ncbi:hypothetical protein F66182_3236 [Fusarium sp. NRRL 66182]|nr:hypothetical protein F66182_3236 [Fusarium sp. NRRL 66182]
MTKPRPDRVGQQHVAPADSPSTEVTASLDHTSGHRENAFSEQVCGHGYNLRVPKRKAGPETTVKQPDLDKQARKRRHCSQPRPAVGGVVSEAASAKANDNQRKKPLDQSAATDLEDKEKSLRQDIEKMICAIEKEQVKGMTLRNQRSKFWNAIQDCEDSIVVEQRYICGLNSKTHRVQDYNLGLMSRLETKLRNHHKKAERKQEALEESYDRVDKLLQKQSQLQAELQHIAELREAQRAQRLKSRVSGALRSKRFISSGKKG